MNYSELRLIFHLKQKGLKIIDIARQSGISESTVRRYLAKAKSQNLSDDYILDLTNQKALQNFLKRTSTNLPEFYEPDWHDVYVQVTKVKKLNLKTLWGQYMQNAPEEARVFTYKTFCKRYQEFCRELPAPLKDVSLTLTWHPAEAVQIDYSGDGVPYTDNGVRRTAQIFVAVMAYSSKIFAYATLGQTRDDWLLACTKMLEYYGGVPENIMLDNSTSLVLQADRYNPRLAREFIAFCDHYRTTPVAVRPGMPRDKALVECSVGIVQKKILRLMEGMQFLGIESVNRELLRRVDELNDLPLTDKPNTTRSQWFDEEFQFLKPLPDRPFDGCDVVKTLLVRNNYQIRAEGKRFSVPYQYVGKKVKVVISHKNQSLEIFDLLTGERIAQHNLISASSSNILREHMPEKHWHMSLTLDELIDQIAIAGPNSRALAVEVYRQYSGLRGRKLLRGLLSRRRTLGDEMFEDCATTTFAQGTASYDAFMSVVDSVAGQQSFTKRKRSGTRVTVVQEVPQDSPNVRGADYFADRLKNQDEEE